MIRGPPRSTLDRWSAASDGYKRQPYMESMRALSALADRVQPTLLVIDDDEFQCKLVALSLIHISEPTRPH